MTLKVAIQTDPWHGVNIDSDSTYILSLEAQKRGYELYSYLPSALTLQENKVMARGGKLALRHEKGNHFQLTDERLFELGEMNVVLMRQEPPFDMAYITATHILEHVANKTLVVNDPVAVRNAPEKLLVTHFPEFCPRTVISSDESVLLSFRHEVGDIIIKPLYDYGGSGVFHLKRDDANFASLMETLPKLYKSPLIAQEYIPAVKEGDKRVILVDGTPIGAFLRVPAHNEIRSNMRTGSVPQKSSLTEREKKACAAIGPELKKRGIILAGLDFIGGHLTEINVTCPTGLQQINKFDGISCEALVWDAIESRLAERFDMGV